MNKKIGWRADMLQTICNCVKFHFQYFRNFSLLAFKINISSLSSFSAKHLDVWCTLIHVKFYVFKEKNESTNFTFLYRRDVKIYINCGAWMANGSCKITTQRFGYLMNYLCWKYKLPSKQFPFWNFNRHLQIISNLGRYADEKWAIII